MRFLIVIYLRLFTSNISDTEVRTKLIVGGRENFNFSEILQKKGLCLNILKSDPTKV